MPEPQPPKKGSRFTPETASEAGRKGGKRAQELGKAHRFRPGEHAREAGKKGGYHSHRPKP